ncbi:HD-GYP domain-containing protein [Alkalicoccus urumqiensis]|uniref:Metal-dependent phosphohydrolase n=1 Tax=Alkalicoccus urumqiensis TaxID=1548213 RepID=A0A2P6MEU3_ALKUR|nr:HD domain-containing phosphohydrolase [Alkalicoccus urumqiensis]PRO64783.1 metal-dependent phosphohydrolase [Alkalicoccus urumqiensis]
MRYKSLDNVNQGEKLGKNILADDGRILLHKGVVLTVGLLTKLRMMGVHSLFIEDDRFPDIDHEEVISETTKRRAVQTLSESIQYIQQDKPVNTKNVQETVTTLLDELMENKDVLIAVTDIRTQSNALFIHLLQVCLMSSMIGIQMGMNRSRLEELAVGALLHDAGKYAGPIPVRELPQGYAGNEEELKHHSWKGFNLLRKSSEISTLSAHIALAHHEHLDGTGAPRGMSEEDIHFLAKIVAVTNDYDRLTSEGEEGEDRQLFPHEAAEYIMSRTGEWYDHNVVWKFLRAVAFYPNGTQVKLSNNRTAVVTGQHKGLPQRPVVRTYERDGESFLYEEIDLAANPTVFITKVYE